MIDTSVDIEAALRARGRQRSLIEGRGPSVQQFLLNPYRFGGGGPPPPTDPLWASVTAALHFDGANGSTTFTDEKGGTWTGSGGAQISTAQDRFGGASLLVGVSGSVARSYSTSLFDWFTSGIDFTLEFWVRPITLSTDPNMIGNMETTSPTNYWSFGTNSSGNPQFYFWNGATNTLTASSITITTGAWSHMVMTQSGGTILLGANGALQNVGSVPGTTPLSSTGIPLTVGRAFSGSINAYLDDLRITRGASSVRYSGSSYTVPTAAFPNS